MRQYLAHEDSWAALARHDGELIAHAFAIRGDTPTGKRITWVTQLVVHEEYRNCGVAKRLLNSLWSFSDEFAWGLVTSNPFAVRALEKATRRRCDPSIIGSNADEVYRFGAERIDYIRDRAMMIDDEGSVIDTEFYVDHSEVIGMIDQATRNGAKWKLGALNEGQEWFAFTFGSQEECTWTPEDIAQLLAASDHTVRHAYERMTLDTAHKWAGHADVEVDYIVTALGLNTSSALADFGCGIGRHLIELGKRGYRGTGIDFVPAFVERAKQSACALSTISFQVQDCRQYLLAEPQDAVICLYDVIGSFADDEQNDAIISNIARNLKPGGRVLASVMNLELTEQLAKHKANVLKKPQALTSLRPSRTMQATGNIFDPDYYLLDQTTSTVYRKEQFDEDAQVPSQLIVRDRRYRRNELIRKFADVGIQVISCTYVQAGHWNQSLAATDKRAKEILFLGEYAPNS